MRDLKTEIKHAVNENIKNNSGVQISWSVNIVKL